MKKLAIYGAGEHGRVVADVAEQSGWSPVFFDDSWPAQRYNGHWNINGGFDELLTSLNVFDGVIVAIGDNKVRLRQHRKLKSMNAPLVSIIHPSSIIGSEVSIGVGTILMPLVCVNFGSVIGDACILNTCSSIDHDGMLCDGVHISPGARAAGNVSIGEGGWLGIGASVIDGLRIGQYSIVGAGSVVISNIADEETVVGVPAVSTNKSA